MTGADADGSCTPARLPDADGTVRSSGGRVLSVTATGADLAAARERAYQLVDQVQLRGSHHRTDIAAAAIDGTITVPGG